MTTKKYEPSARRPLATRGKGWVKAFTRFLLKTKVTPNQVSVMSVIFAVFASVCLYSTHYHFTLWIAAAVEGKLSSFNGDLYNEIPDRLSDVILLIITGYATQSQLGLQIDWLAATGSIMAAYIRMH